MTTLKTGDRVVPGLNTTERIVEAVTMKCRHCDGYGFTSEHDPLCLGNCDGSCPVQVQCEDCHGEGHYITMDWFRKYITALTEKHRAEVEERDAIINKLSHVIQLMNEKPKTYCECSQQTPDTLGFGCSYCLNYNELIIH